jgi:hypothetical protein
MKRLTNYLKTSWKRREDWSDHEASVFYTIVFFMVLGVIALTQGWFLVVLVPIVVYAVIRGLISI